MLANGAPAQKVPSKLKSGSKLGPHLNSAVELGAAIRTAKSVVVHHNSEKISEHRRLFAVAESDGPPFRIMEEGVKTTKRTSIRASAATSAATSSRVSTAAVASRAALLVAGQPLTCRRQPVADRPIAALPPGLRVERVRPSSGPNERTCQTRGASIRNAWHRGQGGRLPCHRRNS